MDLELRIRINPAALSLCSVVKQSTEAVASQLQNVYSFTALLGLAASMVVARLALNRPSKPLEDDVEQEPSAQPGATIYAPTHEREPGENRTPMSREPCKGFSPAA